MLDNSIIEKARNKTLLCLKDNLVLVEMSFISEPLKLQEMIFEIQVNGYIPILAHPERYLFMSNNFLRFEKLKNWLSFPSKSFILYRLLRKRSCKIA